MTATYITDLMATKSTLQEVNNYLVTAKTATRDYQDQYSNTTGDTIKVRKPTYLTAEDGPVMNNEQDIQQRYIDLTVDQNPLVGVGITSKDRTLSLNDFATNVTKPAAEAIANKIDLSLVQNASFSFNNWVGSLASAVNSFATINNANSVLNMFGVRGSDRYVGLSIPDFNALTTAEKTANNFNPALNKDISDEAKITSGMRNYAGFDVYQTQHIRVHTVGNLGGTPLVAGASQTGFNLNTDGWSNSVTGLLKKGDRFTIAGLYSIYPNNGGVVQSTGRLMQFVVTDDVDSSGTGTATIPISPQIITSGPYQNVVASPADNAPLTILGTANSQRYESIAYQRSAITLAPVKFMKEGTWVVEEIVNDDKLKLNMRMVAGGNVTTSKSTYRVEMLAARQAFYEYGCVIVSPLTTF